jgi:hypothetical protein
MDGFIAFKISVVECESFKIKKAKSTTLIRCYLNFKLEDRKLIIFL